MKYSSMDDAPFSSDRRSQLKLVFRDVFQELSGKPCPAVHVEFYPYTDIKHTIRRRQDSLWVRLSDAFSEAPREILCALAQILLRKLLHLRSSIADRQLYQRYLHSHPMMAEIAHLRASRGRLSPPGKEGKFYNLEEIWNSLNSRYFDNRLQNLTVQWSKKAGKSRLGYYRENVHCIVISRSLDHPAIPRYVVEFVVYHEMLHAIIPPISMGNRRVVHSEQFHEQERLFEQSSAAIGFLKKGLSRGKSLRPLRLL